MNVFVTVVAIIFAGALLALSYYAGHLNGWSAGYKYRDKRAQEIEKMWRNPS